MVWGLAGNRGLLGGACGENGGIRGRGSPGEGLGGSWILEHGGPMAGARAGKQRSLAFLLARRPRARLRVRGARATWGAYGTVGG